MFYEVSNNIEYKYSGTKYKWLSDGLLVGELVVSALLNYNRCTASFAAYRANKSVISHHGGRKLWSSTGIRTHYNSALDGCANH